MSAALISALLLAACGQSKEAPAASSAAAAIPASAAQPSELTPIAYTRGSPAAVRKLPTDPRLLKGLGDPAKRLLPLWAALEEIEHGGARRPVEILQIGDSHTANGAFAGRMRELFQDKFGYDGRGMLQPGIPFDYYRPLLVTVEETQRWHLASSFRQTAQGPWGLAGVRETGSRPGERMILTSTEDPGFARAYVEVLRQPGGGRLDIAVDSVPAAPIATSDGETAPGWAQIPVPPGSHQLTLTPHGDGPVDLLSWGTDRGGTGVLYENFGIIGATVDIMGRWDQPIVKAELAERDPALILIAFGTNEGFATATDPAAYKEDFRERVRAVKAAAPNAAILVIGPPDGNRLYKRSRGQVGACVAQVPEGTPIAVSSARQANAKAGSRTIWAPPPRLAELRAVQREVAQEEGWYFWDWSAAMGGPCSMHRWNQLDPPLSADDHVHLKQDGYRKTADALFNELMAHYARYRSLRPTASAAP